MANKRTRNPQYPISHSLRRKQTQIDDHSARTCLYDHEWACNTTQKSRRILQSLARDVLEPANIKSEGFKRGKWYLYIDVDDDNTDWLWVVRSVYTYTPTEIARQNIDAVDFNFFEEENWTVKVATGSTHDDDDDDAVRLFSFDPMVLGAQYRSVMDSSNRQLAISHYRIKQAQMRQIAIVAPQKQLQAKRKQKKRSRHSLGLSKSENPRNGRTRAKSIDCRQKRKRSQRADCATAVTVSVDDGAGKNPEIQKVKKCPKPPSESNASKREHVQHSQSKNADDSHDTIEFFRNHLYYDRQRNRNMPLAAGHNQEPPSKKQKLADLQIVDDTEDDYDLNDWWNAQCPFQLPPQQYDDPGICPPIDEADEYDDVDSLLEDDTPLHHKYKKTCYPPPPVYDSFNETPAAGVAPFPYVCRESITNISAAKILKQIVLHLWDQTCSIVRQEKVYKMDKEPSVEILDDLYLLKNPQIVNVSDTDDSHVRTAYPFHELFSINHKKGDALKQWCLQNSDDVMFDFMSDRDDILAQQQFVEERVLAVVPISSVQSPFMLEMRLDDALQKHIKPIYGDLDLFKSAHVANVRISTHRVISEWRHNFGLCSWYQVLFGELNIKMWDVESSKRIEDYRHRQKDNQVSRIPPKWEIFLRADAVLYVPAGCGHIVSTTSETAVMVCGYFLPQSHVRIAYEMGKHHECRLPGDKDWDELIIQETSDAFNVNDLRLFEQNNQSPNKLEHISIQKRLNYLVKYSKQHNWNIDYDANASRFQSERNVNADDADSGF